MFFQYVQYVIVSVLLIQSPCRLKPMRLAVTQAEGMPDIPVPFEELDTKCTPV